MGALIPLLIPLIPSLVSWAEKAFAGKAKSGPDKMQTVVSALQVVAEGMQQAKAPLPNGAQIADKSVDDQVLRGLVEVELTRLRATGKLDGIAPSGDLFIVRGVVVPIPSA